MPVIIVNGIVTRYVNYRDNDRILTLITAEQGRIDAKARGCRKQSSALLPCAQPFVFGEFELFSGRDKFTVNGCDVRESFFPVREDIARFAAGSSMLQLATEAAQPNEANPALFSLLYRSLSYLAYGTAEPTDLLLCFLAKFLEVAGYRPALTVCARCGRDLRSDARIGFLASAGGAVCAGCAPEAAPASKTALEAVRRMLLLPDDGLDRVRLTEKLQKELIGLLIPYTESALEYGARALSFFRQL